MNRKSFSQSYAAQNLTEMCIVSCDHTIWVQQDGVTKANLEALEVVTVSIAVGKIEWIHEIEGNEYIERSR